MQSALNLLNLSLIAVLLVAALAVSAQDKGPVHSAPKVVMVP
ncbi:hypothetical protein [Thalassococcus lentus]|uniref:Uncharacterized protein n=1 Tax=Thalassococcus lentus TaxID=1210524 RepID=A0ABT4XNM0_9RHOB|nr:hypothetical protein [Thalassococcus lentus]MDA7423543.1 hypothetical protein [Thalassococcus lentus]